MMRDLHLRGILTTGGGNASFVLDFLEAFAMRSGGSLKPEIGAEDFVVSLKGEVLWGNPKPSVEHNAHLLAYETRKDIRAVVHAHPPFSIMMANEMLTLPFEIEESEIFVKGRVSVVEAIQSGTIELAREVAGALRSSDIVVVKRHGVFAVGASPEDAANRIFSLEENSKRSFLRRLYLRLPLSRRKHCGKKRT